MAPSRGGGSAQVEEKYFGFGKPLHQPIDEICNEDPTLQVRAEPLTIKGEKISQ